jgi:hypothetical protein
MINIRVQPGVRTGIRVQNRWIGYTWRRSTRASVRSRASPTTNRASFYGEITDQPGDAPRADMGRHFANRRWLFAAYMRNRMVQTTAKAGLRSSTVIAWANHTAKYTVEDHFAAK